MIGGGGGDGDDDGDGGGNGGGGGGGGDVACDGACVGVLVMGEDVLGCVGRG